MDIIDFKDGHATPKFWVLVNFIYQYNIIEIFMSLILSVLISKSGPQKGKKRQVEGPGRVSDTTLHVVNTPGWQTRTYSLESRVKLDKKSNGNGLEGQKCLVMCVF